MHRMKKEIALLGLLAFAFPAVVHAAPDKTGRLAVGYFSPDAPLGIRYTASPRAAVDLGIGFAQEVIGDDPTTVAAGDQAKNLELHVDAGVPFTLVTRDRVNLFLRPGVLFRFIPTYHRATPADPYEKQSETEVQFTGILGAEWFATDDLSLSVGQGIEIVSTKGVDANDLTTGTLDSTTTIDGLQALDLTRIGFHFYF
ncbi:MAG TPA: hypothetical protein VF363_08940 [Candidatus Eisenbacteria bacterium]